MPVSRPLVRLLMATLLLLVGAMAVGIEFAGACSCKGTDPRDRLAANQAALIGRVLAKRPQDDTVLGDPGFEYTVRVDREFNVELGPEVKITAGKTEIACGFQWKVGERVGAFVQRFRDGWATNLCSLVEPTELERAALPYPNPLGRGRPALLAGGRFGSARLIALDARGRILGYGSGGGQVRRISVCPESRRVAELVDRGDATLLAVRSLRSLRVVRTVTLPRSAVELHCADPAGSLVFAASLHYRSERSPGRVRVLQARGRRVVTVATRNGDTIAFGPATAYVGGRTGVLSIDLMSGRTRRAAGIPAPRFLAASPDGRHLAALDRKSLHVIELPMGRIRSLRVSHADALMWLRHDRLILRRGSNARIYSLDLRLVRRYRFPGAAEGQAQVGRRLFGVDRYRLVALDLRSGRRRAVATLPDPDTLHLVAVPGAPALRTGPYTPPRAATARRPLCSALPGG